MNSDEYFSTEEDGLHKSIMNIMKRTHSIRSLIVFHKLIQCFPKGSKINAIQTFTDLKTSVHIIQFILFISLKR